MGSISFRALASLALLAAVVAGQPAPKEKKEDKGKPLVLPPGTVMALFDKPGDVYKLVPGAVFLAPEDFKALLQAAERLKALADAPVYEPPSTCDLKGHAENGLLVLTATFEFNAARPGTLVRLGCGQGQATSVSLNGKTPALLSGVRPGKSDPPGFALRAERAGDQKVVLKFLLPITTRPGGQGFALDLPRAAITTIDLDLPPGSSEPRIGGKLPEGGAKFKGRKLAGPVGPLERLEVLWRSPAAADPAVLSADGEVVVKAGPRETTCEATLSLKVEGGQVKDVKLLVPRGAEVSAGPAAVDIRQDKKQPLLRTLSLKEATSDKINVTIRTTGPPLRPGGVTASVGPFAVLGAVRQAGTIFVGNAVPEWHLELKPQAGLARRELSDEELKRDSSLVAAFTYGHNAPSGPAWLTIEAERVQGRIEARASHVLRLVKDEDGYFWRVETAVRVTPRWSEVGRLVVSLPPNCEWEPEPSAVAGPRVRSASFNPGAGWAWFGGRLSSVEFRFKEGGGPGNTPVTVRLVARYPGPLPDTGKDYQITLPQPEGTLDQEGTLTVLAPAGLELLPADNAALELTRQGPHDLNYRFARRVATPVALSWKPYSAPAEVTGLVSLRLYPGLGRVTHEFSYKFPAAEAPGQLRLQLPPSLARAVKLEHGRATVHGNQLRFAPPKDGKIVLSYDFPLPAEGPIQVPLAEPEKAGRVETKALIWSETGRLPALNAEGWAEAPIEEVKGDARLPVLVARSSAGGRPLVLRFVEHGAAGACLVSRALVRATIREGGEQSYRVSYRLERLSATHIDFDLPGNAAAINLRATLDGKAVGYEPLSAGPTPRGRRVRLRLSPGLVKGAAVLRLEYDLPPASDQLFSVPLAAPKLVGGPPGLSARWQINAPPGWVLLGPEPGASMPRAWGLSGWLIAPRPVLTGADLEQWLVGGKPGGAGEEDSPAESLALVLWLDGGRDVAVVRASRQSWLLGCSLVVFVVGLALGWLGTREGAAGPAWAWALGLALLGGVVVGASLCPFLAGQVVFGSQPGLAVLLVLGLGLWLLHERRRRQLLFLPSFTRSRPGSSMTGPPPTPGPRGEQPSTVDAPRNIGGLERLGG